MKYIATNIKNIVYADDTTIITQGRSQIEALQKANDALDRFYK